MENKYDLEFDWHLTNRCNFFCEYCHPQIRRVLNVKDLNEPTYDVVVKRFNEIGKICYVHMSGGEPFLYPSFDLLCEGLTKQHFISINTNLSHDVERFVSCVPPERCLFITAALHSVERERTNSGIDRFIKHACILQESGFKLSIIFVAFPAHLERMAKDIEFLREAGIRNVCAKVFKGPYNGKRYPESYEQHEREIIIRYSGSYPFNKNYMNGEMSFKNLECNAGMSSFKIMVTGDVHRCATVRGDYGNLYNGTFKPMAAATPCPANRVLVVSQCHRYLVESPLVTGDVE